MLQLVEIAAKFGDRMMILLEEYKHNNHINIHNIKLISQRAPVSLLGSYVLMFFCVCYRAIVTTQYSRVIKYSYIS